MTFPTPQLDRLAEMGFDWVWFLRQPVLRPASVSRPWPRTVAAAGSAGRCPLRTRRGFLFLVGVGFNVLAGVLLTLPLVGYVLSSRRRKLPAQWISLEPVANFPAGTTRLAEYRNPLTRPWDGKTGDIPCWVRSLGGGKIQVFAETCGAIT
jgi:hypothetical protein